MKKEEVIERLKEDILDFFTSDIFSKNNTEFWPIDNLEERIQDKWHISFSSSDFKEAIVQLKEQGLIDKRECIRLED